jgi:multicomponent Na+:H+ antiporter subunit E
VTNLLLANVLLALAWVALTGSFQPSNFLAGFVLGYAALWLLSRTIDHGNYFRKLPQIVSFILFFVWELFKANIRVLWEVITPTFHMKPGIVGIPLDVTSDHEITLLANLITLTPGTLSLDVSDDRRVLYVHTMYMDDVESFRRSIKDGFERRVMEIFR